MSKNPRNICNSALHGAFFIFVVSAIVGCGHAANDRRPISGAVTLDGKTIDGGNIQFCPVAAERSSISGAIIKEGRYSIPRESGLKPGKYCVRIFMAGGFDASKIPDAATAGPRTPIEIKELIPARYNTASELTIELRDGSSTTFDFALLSTIDKNRTNKK